MIVRWLNYDFKLSYEFETQQLCIVNKFIFKVLDILLLLFYNIRLLKCRHSIHSIMGLTKAIFYLFFHCRCKVCFKVLLFQYEKLASHVTDSHGIKMSAYVR